MSLSPLHLAVLAFAVALAGAVGGLYFSSLPAGTRFVIPFSGGLLLGVAVFGLLPEIAEETGWWKGLPVVAAGYLLIFAVDRSLHVVCPSCSHAHNHDDCARSLHGFTTPLLLAAAMHAFLDGWGLATVNGGTSTVARLAFPAAVMLHKAPEGLALGAIFRASSKSRLSAFVWCLLAESFTLAGSWTGLVWNLRLGSRWTNYPLALAAGFFLYLGYHAIHGEWKSRGARPTFAPAFGGIAGAAMVQQGLRIFGG